MRGRRGHKRSRGRLGGVSSPWSRSCVSKCKAKKKKTFEKAAGFLKPCCVCIVLVLLLPLDPRPESLARPPISTSWHDTPRTAWAYYPWPREPILPLASATKTLRRSAAVVQIRGPEPRASPSHTTGNARARLSHITYTLCQGDRRALLLPLPLLLRTDDAAT